MNKTIVFSDEFTDETIKGLIYEIEDITSEFEEKDKLTLYFSSCGGNLNSLIMLVDYLNNLKIEIDIVIHGYIYSAGFFTIFLLKKHNIVFTISSEGMLHKGYMRIFTSEMLDTNKKYSTDVVRVENLNKVNKYFDDNVISKLNLTKKELDMYNLGYDVYFDSDRLKELYTDFRNGDED